MTRGTLAVPIAAQGESGDAVALLRSGYLEMLNLIERLHRHLLDVIGAELSRGGHKDINSVQALLLFNIGAAELTAGELRSKGHYLGSNVSYNLKKLVDGGYIDHERSMRDRRSVLVKLTEKGMAVSRVVAVLYERHLDTLLRTNELRGDQLATVNASLRSLERFWSDQIRFGL